MGKKNRRSNPGSVDTTPRCAGADACWTNRLRLVATLVVAVVMALPARAIAQPSGTVFPVGQIEIAYGRGSVETVPTEDLRSAQAVFTRYSSGVLGRAGEPGSAVRMALREFSPTRVERLDAGGIRQILEAVREMIVQRTGTFAYVVPDQDQIMLRGAGEDYRGGSNDLRVLVFTSTRRVTRPAPAATAPASAAQPAPATEPTRSSRPNQPTEPAQPAAQQPRQPAPAQQTQPVSQPAPVAEPVAEPAAEPASGPGADPVYGGEDIASAEADAELTPPRPFRASSAPKRTVAPSEVPIDNDTEIDDAMDGEPVSMTGFAIEYAREHPNLPDPSALDDVAVRLVRVPGGFVARPGEGAYVRLGDLGANGPVNLYKSAVMQSMVSIVEWFGERSIVGVFVTPDERRGMLLDRDVLLDGRSDPEYGGITDIPLVVFVPKVTEITSIASGTRIPTEDRLESPKHAWIRNNSPVQPYEGEGRRRDLIRFADLNAYAYRLSRHPGRQVNVAIANASDPDNPAETQGNAEVQYLVQEIKPWTAYFQLSNTGTEETSEWRERFGLVHNQLIGFDDILSLDYITSNFRESHAIIGSYDFPISHDGRLRFNVNGEWTKYRASDVGVADEEFAGESHAIGGELVFNFFQRDDFFIDWFGGGKYRDIEVINRTADLIGDEEVFVAETGLRFERRRPEVSFGAEVGLNWSINNLTGADEADLAQLGRPAPDEEWMALVWNSDLSFFLDGIGSWNRRPPALVHEIATRFSGQYAFNDRLIPNYEAIGGGLYSARGYDESVVAGDNAVFGSIEYRLHIPRAFPANDNPPTAFGRPFRVAPDGGGGLPDWDLIFKTFLDMGRVTVNRAFDFERDETLFSTGVGLELMVANNISFRTDWGIVLEEVASNSPDPIEVGDSRFHFVLTVLY